MSKLKLGIISGLVLLLSGTGLLIGIIRYQDVNSANIVQPPNHTVVVKPTSTEIQGEPTEIIIPSLNIDLSIIPGYYNKNSKTWTLSLDKVQYATITPEPNNVEGSTFLYGHYRPAVFAYLHTIHANAQAIVKTANNHTFYYQLANVRTTNPGDDSVFNYRGQPILSVQTCTGLFFQNRQFYTFDLERVV
jgi:sortase (surface protein transpeptidase)